MVVESPAVETSTAYAARLAAVLREGALGTARISYRIDASRLEAHALLYLPLDTLRTTLDTIAGQEDLLADFAATPDARSARRRHQPVRRRDVPARRLRPRRRRRDEPGAHPSPARCS